MTKAEQNISDASVTIDPNQVVFPASPGHNPDASPPFTERLLTREDKIAEIAGLAIFTAAAVAAAALESYDNIRGRNQ